MSIWGALWAADYAVGCDGLAEVARYAGSLGSEVGVGGVQPGAGTRRSGEC